MPTAGKKQGRRATRRVQDEARRKQGEAVRNPRGDNTKNAPLESGGLTGHHQQMPEMQGVKISSAQ